METVELHQAFTWTCESCGIDQFENAITLSMESLPAEDIEAIKNTFGLSTKILVAPERVICDICQTEYNTVES